MPHPRIIRALELIHEAKEYLAPNPRAYFQLGPAPSLLDKAENELLLHLAEVKRAERTECSRIVPRAEP
jgi:hypothetical protein